MKISRVTTPYCQGNSSATNAGSSLRVLPLLMESSIR